MIRRSALATLLAAAAACAREDAPRVRITSPVEGTPTNATIAVAIAYDGKPVSAVLLVDGTPHALEAPFTAATLDTTALAEGDVKLEVEATFRDASGDGGGGGTAQPGPFPLPSAQPTDSDGADAIVRSAPVTIRVDRTPPEIVSASVVEGGPADPADTVVFHFSEPVAFDAITFDWGDTGTAPPITYVHSKDRGTLTVRGLPDDRGRAIRSIRFALHFETMRDAAGNAMTRPPFAFTWLTQPRMNADPAKAAYAPAFARDPSGAPVLAWSEMRPWVVTGAEGEGPFVQLARWDGAAWGALPFTSGGTPAGYGWDPDLAFDGAGRPVVIATDVDSAVRVTRRSGSDWAPVGGPLSTPWDFTPAIAAHGAELVAAWIDEIPTGDPTSHSYCGDVAVARWDGAAWTQLGGHLNAEGTCGQRPKVAYDGTGRPWVAWQGLDGLIHTASWSDTEWLARGAIPTATFDLASDQGDVVLLTGVDALQLWKWGPGEWLRGASLATSPPVYFFGPPALSDDGAAVAWIDGDGVHAAVLGASGALEPVGTLQVSAIPESPLHAWGPTVAREADGTVVVAFTAYLASGSLSHVHTHAFTP